MVKDSTFRSKLKKEINSVLSKGQKRRKRAKSVQDRQKVLRWEMEKIRHAYGKYRKAMSALNERTRLEPELMKARRTKRPKRAPRWTDKKPSQKTRRY